MQNRWQTCKRILIIRPDNMGDILMSTPAIQALKTTFNCHVTLLTSSMGKPITEFIPCIDEVIVYNFPWVKSSITSSKNNFNTIIKELKKNNFDSAIIFNVYSQNPLPSVMLAYLAGIPLRLAYCRENPYGLLTDWLPDEEPYSYILHQVKRDLKLVEYIGAMASSTNKPILNITENCWPALQLKLKQNGIDLNKKWIIAHAGVSEEKRKYPENYWVQLSEQIFSELDCQVLFTGSNSEAKLTEQLVSQTREGIFSLGGKLDMEEFLLLINKAPLVISVNTVTIHIAAAINTPIIVLYALTNPQHLPWKAKGKVLPYQVSEQLKSKNQIIKYVTENLHPDAPDMQSPDKVFKEVFNIFALNKLEDIPEMFELKINKLV